MILRLITEMRLRVMFIRMLRITINQYLRTPEEV